MLSRQPEVRGCRNTVLQKGQKGQTLMGVVGGSVWERCGQPGVFHGYWQLDTIASRQAWRGRFRASLRVPSYHGPGSPPPLMYVLFC